MAITAAELQVRISADTREAERALQSVSDRLGSFGKDAAKIGGLLTLGVTAPLAGVAHQALSTAMSYQSALNLMQAVSGATAEQMQQVSERAKELGADMSLPATSAADAARAMTELAKAGLSVEQSMAAAKGVLQLAAAGGLSEAAAAEIAANALNAFSLSGERATDVANLLAAAANASSAEVFDVAASLRMASAVFASAGVPIEELVAAIGQMANAGIKGSDAGTSLKQMLLSLQAPSNKAKELMADLGITIYDAQGAMLPFPKIIEQFSTKLGGLSQEQRNAALATIFGSDAVRAANIVLMQGVDAHERMLQAVTRQGAAAELAGARMRGLAGALQGLQSQVETVLLEVAEPFLQTLEGWVRGLADLVPRISELDPNLRNAALAFAAVLAAAGPVILAVGALATAIGFLLSPVGLVVLAVAALAAAWTTNFLGIRDITASVLDAVSGVVQKVIGFVAPFVQREIGVLVAWWTANVPLMQRTVEAVMNAINSVVTFVLTQVQTFWQAHGEQVISIVQSVWTIIKTVVDTHLQILLNLITLVMQAITGDWQGAWNTIQNILQITWTSIITIGQAGANILTNILSIAWDGIKAGAETGWNAIAGAIASIWNGIVETIKGRINQIISMINQMIRAWNSLGFHVPGFSVELPSVEVPGVGRVGGGHLSWGGIDISPVKLPEIPMLAMGGIVTRPTLALIGDRGPEAVIPLRDSAALDVLAERIADAIMRRPQQVFNLTAQYRYQDERSLRDEIRLLQLLGAST